MSLQEGVIFKPPAVVVADIQWSRPWLAPFMTCGQSIAMPEHGNTADALNATKRAPVRFVPQSDLPVGQSYEQFIFESGTVPTRDNMHDFFNGLCWMHFPQIKKKLNQLQALEMTHAGVNPVRGPVRDALTLFDENAAFLFAPQPLWDALIAKDWILLFVDLRPLWRQAQLVLFGHALLEKLVNPRKPITAHVYRTHSAINAIASSLDDLDAWVAADLSADKLSAKPFAPLPVLGVPGWWPENENPLFYGDILVFRPAK